MEYTAPVNSSWVWRAICKVKERMKSGFINGQLVQQNGQYKIRVGYNWLKPSRDKVAWHPYVWNSVGPEKYHFHSWVMAQNRLKTLDRLYKQNVVTHEGCYLCGIEKETHEHLFFQCEYSVRCLKEVKHWLQIDISEIEPIKWWLQKRFKSLKFKKYVGCIMSNLSYRIWKERNSAWQAGAVIHPNLMREHMQREFRLIVQNDERLTGMEAWIGKVTCN